MNDRRTARTSGGDRRNERRSLVGSAITITRDMPGLRKMFGQEEWQAKAWEYYDTIGELRFGAGWIAKALSKVRLISATVPEQIGDEPVQQNSGPGVLLVKALAGGFTGQTQMLNAFGKLLTVSGVAYLVIRPGHIRQWSVFSSAEIRNRGDTIEVFEDRKWSPLPDNVMIVKVWMGHPNAKDEPDAPVRSVLPVLRQIQLIDQRIEADAVSRLAGAGILVVPSEATFPKPPDAEGDEDDLDRSLLNAMSVPITNRASASAVVPFIVRVPAQFADAVHHIKLATDFDASLLTLRDSGIRRLALGLDMPPETLLGGGDSNHWSLWAIQEEAIALHIEPMMEIICHALNIGYFLPGIASLQGDPTKSMLWYDSSDLRNKPDKSELAVNMHGTLDINDEALLRETGFNEEDKPELDEWQRRYLADLVMAHPDLLPVLAPFMQMPMLGGISLPVSEEAPEDKPEDPPSTDGPPAERDSDRTGLLVAADLLVNRALEKAGARLRTKMGKVGHATVDSPNTALHTRVADVTKLVNLDELLVGAWNSLETTSAILGLDHKAFQLTLDRYTRSLLANGTPHDLDRLGQALGVTTSA